MLLVDGVWAAAFSAEHEPNDTPAQANRIYSANPMQGNIDPAGDGDYFKARGYGNGWGVVALLDVSESTGSKDGVLAAYAPDGATLRAQNAGRWAKGQLIAWLRDTDDSQRTVLPAAFRNGDSMGQSPFRQLGQSGG